MTLLPLLGWLRALPWQAWAVIALALGVGLYGCQQYDRGHDAAVSTITRSNERAKEKADAASRRVEDCAGVWDRSLGVCVLGNGAGR